jgi:hypothetical protein
VGAEIACCSFYDGSSLETELSTAFRPNRFYTLTARHNWTQLGLPTGDVDIHVATVGADITFTPNMQLQLQTQYDNISENIGLLARYRWQFQPASELLIAFGQAAVIPRNGFEVQRTQLTIRIGHTLQF